jgi:uncharacterized membrane protein
MNIKKITYGSSLLALAVLLPFLTASNPSLGSIFLLMHIPALLGGFILGGKMGGIIGFIMPLFRSVLISTPPLYPVALIMAFELGAYGLFAGIFFKLFQKYQFGYLLALVLAMIVGRFVWGITSTIILSLTNRPYSFEAFISSAFITALPGIAIQIILIPLLVRSLIVSGHIEAN